MAFIQNAGHSNRDVKPVARRSGFIQSVRKMEQACFKEMNRLVRTRILGGVGGARRKPAPIPIALILIMASLSEAVCPLPLIVEYVLADVNPQLDL